MLLVAWAHAATLAEAEAQLFQAELLRLPPAAFDAFAADPDPIVRARAARGLAQLRVANERIVDLAADPDPRVRRAAAFALGQTPATASAIMERWGVEADPEAREALARSLGRQGGPEAIPVLVDALGKDARWLDRFQGGLAAAAAEALGRMGIRKVEGATGDPVVSALLDRIEFPVGQTRRSAAWALARMGITRLSSENAARLQEAAEGDGETLVRAWLVRAAAVAVPDDAWYERMARDPAPAVRIAVARAIGKHRCAGSALQDLMDDPLLAVRLEAMAASAECRRVELVGLGISFASADPVERAAALKALARRHELEVPIAGYATAEFPIQVRVAAVEATTDRKRLMDWALRAEDPRVRSAAAGVLMEDPRAAEVLDLLAAKDPLIAQAAADAVREKPDPLTERPLLDLLARRELPRAVAVSAFRALSAVYATGRLPRPGPDAANVVRQRWLALPELAEEAAQLAGVLRLELPTAAHADRRIPSLAEVRRIRGARVYTSRGELRLTLLPEEAPLTVWNFATLAESGYFDGLVFHRVVPDFVIQTGDPRGDGWGGPGWEIPDELGPEHYDAGTVGMALSGPDTGGSQWFITLSPQPHLDGTYPIFARLVQGMYVAQAIEVGDRIERVEVERIGA
jgi:cyclophilin family peptidyl-prolyl cis-trans isomerase/HEAT repeat protein